MVGPGTPAAKAGMKPGDVIKSFDGSDVTDIASLEALLAKTQPRQKVRIAFVRNGKQMDALATLTRIPLEVIKPENDDPLSMLLTLQQFDDQKISDDEKAEKAKWDAEDKERKKESDDEEPQLKDKRHLGLIGRELEGVNLRTANWNVVPTGDKNVVKFRYTLPEKGLEITKTYRLAEVPAESQKDESYQGYHLEFEIEIRNISKRRRVAQSGLPARRPERPAHRRRLVRKPGDSLGRIGASRLHRFVRRPDAGHGRGHEPLPPTVKRKLPVRPDAAGHDADVHRRRCPVFLGRASAPAGEPGGGVVRRTRADPRRQGRSEAHESDEHVVPAG